MPRDIPVSNGNLLFNFDYELDEVIDVSLLGLANLGVLPPEDPRMVETIKSSRKEIHLLRELSMLNNKRLYSIYI